MVSAITSQGKVCWVITEGALNAERHIEFLEGLLRQAPRRVFLILDNLRVPQGYVVNDWIEENKSTVNNVITPG